LRSQQADTTDVRVEVIVQAPIERTFQAFTERVGSWWPRAYRLGADDWVDVRIEPHVSGRWYGTRRTARTATGGECWSGIPQSPGEISDPGLTVMRTTAMGLSG